MTTTETEMVHVVLGIDSDYERPYVYEASEGDADGQRHTWEADVPKALVDQMHAGWKSAEEAILAVFELAAIDEESGRRKACCDRWQGDVGEGHEWWEVTVAASGDEETWPVRDANLSHYRSEAEALAVLADLPEEFYIANGKLWKVQKDRLTVEHKAIRGYESDCSTCGWSKAEHDA